MKRQPTRWISICGISLVLMTLGCDLLSRAPTATQTVPPTRSPVQEPTETPAPGLLPTPTNLPEPGITPTAEQAAASPQPGEADSQTEGCPPEACVVDGLFLLKRPIAADGRNTIVYSSRYGGYQAATRQAQRGVFFLNSSGTPVLAAAEGEVVVAGDDSQRPYGPFLDLYGNLVILEHNLSGLSDPLYTVYAHLSKVSVQVGDQVEAGEAIGLVGMSGNATGSSLLFEVRLGNNHFDAARNPELWLKPLPDESGARLGALAGRVIDKNGKYIKINNIVLERLAGPGLPAIDQVYLRTYTGKTLAGQSPWEENFAAGDLPAGEYQITFLYNGLQQRVITVEAGRLTLVTYQVE